MQFVGQANFEFISENLCYSFRFSYKLSGQNVFFYYLFLTCVSSHGQKRWASQRRGAGRKDTSLFPKIKDRKEREKKRRYMKSSCRWAIIHFHFEVLWTVVKCDCMWQSPSLPVYHDGCTLPPRWCCTACVCACTNTDRRMNTERHRSGIMLGRCTQKQNYKPSGYTHALTCRYTLF